jgi:steroid delta-isomerase-like uncharacterized protein
MGQMTDAKQLIAEYIESVWNNADLASLDDLTLATFTYHLGGRPPRNKAQMKSFLQAVHTAFPDWRVQIRATIAEGNTVAVQWDGTVTHLGEFQGIPPTGKKVSVSGINMYWFEDGKIAREWEQMDTMGMLQQLGVIPPEKS